MKKYITVFLNILSAIIIGGCVSTRTITVPTITNFSSAANKIGEMTEVQLKHWANADIIKDSIPGISLEKSYLFFAKKKSQPVIVAVIDGSIDIDHEDLKDVIWVNTKEIPNNNKDDDKNGYIDDVHGWNFLGSAKGDMLHAQLEITRIIQTVQPRFDGKMRSEINDKDTSDFILYHRLRPIFDKSSTDVSQRYVELVAKFQSDSGDKGLEKYIHFLEAQNRFSYNIDFDPREIIGDDPNNINDTGYGNERVNVFINEDAHGTHVAGIIAASRDNGKGIDGIANNVKIMTIRAIPKGDEYDKDVALAIRYAVDNGASIINMSFGKLYSSHSDWVYDATKYAEGKDVLMVNAAGNDYLNLDSTDVFPNDSKHNNKELVDNFITVGAITHSFNEKLIAPFSNYGKTTVDIFAPGTQIFSTVPNNKYDYDNGTSVAAPIVSGIAALIRSYYPKLKASQVKHIIMDSGIQFDNLVIVPGGLKARKFSQLSVSEKIVNAYNALVMAEELNRRKR